MDVGRWQARSLFAVVIVRRFVWVGLGAALLVLAFTVASNAVIIHRSGGCNHIPLTAAGQPAYPCSSRP